MSRSSTHHDPWKQFLRELHYHVAARPGLSAHQMEIVIQALIARHPQVTRIKSFIGSGEFYACKTILAIVTITSTSIIARFLRR